MKIVLDLFVFYKDECIVIDRKEDDTMIVNCLTSIWQYLEEGKHPVEQIKEIGKKMNFEVDSIRLVSMNLVHFAKDPTDYFPVVFRVEAKKKLKLKGNGENKYPGWMKFNDLLKNPKLFEEYKKIGIDKVMNNKQYFCRIVNDQAGNKNISVKFL